MVSVRSPSPNKLCFCISGDTTVSRRLSHKSVTAYETMSKGIMGIAGSKLVDEAHDVSASMKEAAQRRVLMLSTSFSLRHHEPQVYRKQATPKYHYP